VTPRAPFGRGRRGMRLARELLVIVVAEQLV
jgi:hypothetical protein